MLTDLAFHTIVKTLTVYLPTLPQLSQPD